MFTNQNSIDYLFSKKRLLLLQFVLFAFGFFGLEAMAQTTVKVKNLKELCESVQKSNQNIVLKAGKYDLTELPKDNRKIDCSGSNNIIDLTGVYVNAPVGSTKVGYIVITGSKNTFKGGTFEDTYVTGLTEVTDFSAYNQNRALLSSGLKGQAVLTVSGDDNIIENIKLTVRGSFPYGYGSIYGIGKGNTFGLNKRCGILLNGKRNIIDGCEVQQRAFGHGIYMQEPADESVIKNTLVEGRLRPSADLYLETKPDDLPFRSNYIAEDKPIPKNVMLPLSEDGIRVYTKGGSVTVDNCTVIKMRGGIRTYLASAAVVTNSTAVDCGFTNFNLPQKGKISGSKGNFSYAPLNDFRLSKSNQNIELTIIPSPNAMGDHNIADIEGNNHQIVFHRTEGPLDIIARAIVVKGNNSTIKNETEYPIVLDATATGNTIVSFGKVTDLGTNNRVTQIKKQGE